MASIQEDNGKTTKPIEVSVVDVDTISQVKQKIIDEVYKDKAYSECPKPDDYDFGEKLQFNFINCLFLFTVKIVTINISFLFTAALIVTAISITKLFLKTLKISFKRYNFYMS